MKIAMVVPGFFIFDNHVAELTVDDWHNEKAITMDLIVDGYNLIGSDQGLVGALEPKRNWLVQRLSAYQKIKEFNLTVVFDGWRSGRNEEVAQKKDGVTVVYSQVNEKADAVIIRLARQKGAGSVVVTSDREIRSAVERFGSIAVSAGEFNQILRALDGNAYDEDFSGEEFDAPQKGNPRRASKSDRRRNDKLRKLRL
ncbi:MAG: NYN domain-containing protein [Candidatus Binatia bacterium]